MRSKYSILTIVFLLSLVLSGCGASEILVIRNGTVITGDGSEPIQEGLVAVEGNHIIYVGPEVEYSIPPGAEVLDAGGGTITPGFIDSHTLSTSDPALRRQFLINGVTTVCDLGSPLDQLPDFSINSYQDLPVARGIAAGPIITAPGGLPDAVLGTNLNYEVASPEEGRAAVEDLYQKGARQIKVYLQQEVNGVLYPMLDQATLEAIVERAHEKGLLVRAHVTYIHLLEMAVTAGVDTVQHLPVNVPSAVMDQEGEEIRSQMLGSPEPLTAFLELFPEYQSQLEIMVDSGIILVPTLDRPYGDLFRASSQDPELAAVMEIFLGLVGRFHDMGGVVGLGTDFNINNNLTVGIPLGELEMLKAAGLTALEVIQASTQNAAAACGLGDELGTLETGKIADLIVVAGDPLLDLMALDEVTLVIKDGQLAYESNLVE